MISKENKKELREVKKGMEEKILNQTERITEDFAEKTEGNELRTHKRTENQKNREIIYRRERERENY